jgi:hypothetical protein
VRREGVPVVELYEQHRRCGTVSEKSDANMQKAKAKAEQVSGRAKETLGRAREKVADQRAKRAGSDERSMRERLKDAKDAFKR